MRIALFTNEYPPHVYGGAGVHVEYLSRELARAEDAAHQVDVLCFGDQSDHRDNLRVRGFGKSALPALGDPRQAPLFDALARNLAMAGAAGAPDIAHCHTWYTHFAGALTRPLTGARLVLTTHSLEPHRPWKVEQLGAAYEGTKWIERSAYEKADGVIAVSMAMKQDVEQLYGVAPDRVRVIHNGIDPDEFRPLAGQGDDVATLRRLRIDPGPPIVLFVGRITRQKGILHLVRAIRYLEPGVQVVLCAGAPDTPAIAEEMRRLVDDVTREVSVKVIWIPEMLQRPDLVSLYSRAAVFVCPSVYEPFGIINLEAMACGTPVVGAAVGGIPEIVIHGETGLLVPFVAEGGESAEPRDADGYSRSLAEAINQLVRNPELRRSMGVAARRRVIEHFSWRAIAAQTLDFYREIIGRSAA